MGKVPLGFWLAICLVALLHGSRATKYEEPMCTSRFDFEEKLLHKLVRMEHAMELLQERVNQGLAEMKEENKAIRQEVTNFRETIKSETSDALDSLEQYKLDLEKDRLNLTSEIERMSEENEAKLKKIELDIGLAINKSTERKVVFSVQDASGKLVDGVPTFTQVHVNIGDAYDMSTGKFTCNKEGVYMFTFLLRSYSSDYSICRIRKNGSNVNYALSDGSYDMASVTVYSQLKVGDVVDLGGCYNWDSSRYERSSVSFSGMLI